MKDLKSRNGTYVNGQRVEDTVKIKAGDRIQIGATIFVLEAASTAEDAQKGLEAVKDAMADGKGYTTILKEIVEDIVPTEGAAQTKPPAPAESKPAAAPPAASKPSGRPAIKITIKKPT